MKILPWVVVFVLALLLGVGVARWMGHPHGSDPIVDTVIISAPAVHDSTMRVLARADSAIAVSVARSDTIKRYQARARTREDSINALEDTLAALTKDTTRTPHQLASDSNAVCRQQLGLRTRESQDHQAATSVCQRDRLALRDTLVKVGGRLKIVQARADSIPEFVKRAVDAAPCRRDWGLFHVPCWVQDVAEISTAFTAGAAVH